MLTGHGTVQGAVDAVRAGARDYLMRELHAETMRNPPCVVLVPKFGPHEQEVAL